MKWCTLSRFGCVWLFVTPLTVAQQAPLSKGFSRQEYWSGLACTPPGDLPDPQIEPTSPMSPALAGGFLTTSASWEAPSNEGYPWNPRCKTEPPDVLWSWSIAPPAAHLRHCPALLNKDSQREMALHPWTCGEPAGWIQGSAVKVLLPSGGRNSLLCRIYFCVLVLWLPQLNPRRALPYLCWLTSATERGWSGSTWAENNMAVKWFPQR